VYVLALASAVRILEGRIRIAAAVAFVLVTVVAVFSSTFLIVPAAAALLSLGLRRMARRRLDQAESRRVRRGRRPRRPRQPAADICNVPVNGVLAEDERACDLTVREA